MELSFQASPPGGLKPQLRKMSSQVQKAKCAPRYHKSLFVVTAKHPITEVRANFEQHLLTINKIWKKSCLEIKRPTTDSAHNCANSFQCRLKILVVAPCNKDEKKKFVTHLAGTFYQSLNVAFLCFVDRASRYNRVKINQLDAQLILSIFRQPLHVSGVSRPIIRRYNRMYTTIGTYYSF